MDAGYRDRQALARLTANEKACLRRRLLPQTAKEMAADLGITPHAVEKRLKTARMKLGVSSSLVAARMLADWEGYQKPVPQPSDLPAAPRPEEETDAAALPKHGRRPSPPKGYAMIVIASLAVLIAQDVAPPIRPNAGARVERLQDTTTRKVGPDEASAFIKLGFDQKDLDHDGSLNAKEASAMEPRDTYRDASLPPAPAIGQADPAAERKWMPKLDTDRNGVVSWQEYDSYMLPWILWQGVPADWHPAS